MMAGKLEGKVALITGGNSGIGFATAKRFVDEGAFVNITGRRQAKLDAAVKQLGPQAKAIQNDATKMDDLDALMTTSEATRDESTSCLPTRGRRAWHG
jgi:NAD(P)-dependent dehydrogenase (short-subunit alcohol dehydrogenase family)